MPLSVSKEFVLYDESSEDFVGGRRTFGLESIDVGLDAVGGGVVALGGVIELLGKGIRDLSRPPRVSRTELRTGEGLEIGDEDWPAWYVSGRAGVLDSACWNIFALLCTLDARFSLSIDDRRPTLGEFSRCPLLS